MSALRAEKKLKNSLIFFRASRDFGTFKPKKCFKKTLVPADWFTKQSLSAEGVGVPAHGVPGQCFL